MKKILGEAVLLTGGASRRMGRDKAGLVVDGQPLVERLVAQFQSIGWGITVLGRTPVAGASFIEDSDDYAGPLSCLRRFVPSQKFVFVASCDLVCFNPALVLRFREAIGDYDAVMPTLDGFDQTLCALYHSRALDALGREESTTRVRDWIANLHVLRLGISELAELGVDRKWVQSANTPEEFQKLLLSEG